MKKFLFMAALALSAGNAFAGEPLTWSKPLIDGATYAIVNVQPSNATSNYYLNNNGGVLTPVAIAKDATTDFEWPASAKFVAQKQADGRFTFKNIENDQYLAWRGASGGANENKGFTAEANDNSTWTMHEATKFANTYWFNAKRANNDAGTLILSNAGQWNAWGNSEVTGRDDFSNDYGFVCLSNLYNVHYNYFVDGVKMAEEDITTLEGTDYPTVALPYGVSATFPTGTVDSDQTVNIDCTISNDLPFKYSADYASATWYMLTIRGSYVPYYDEATNEFPNTGNGGAKVKEDKGYFAFVGNPWGTKIINRAAGAEKAITADPTVNNIHLTTTNFDDAIEFVFENNNNHFVFAAKDNRIAHLNNVSSNSNLGFWVNGSSATDSGSTLTFEEVNFDVDVAKVEALALASKLGEGYGKYNFDGDFEAAVAACTTVDEVNAVVAGIKINLPQPGTFLRIKGYTSKKYISGNGTEGQAKLTENEDATSILYLNESSQLVGYVNGRGFSGTHSVAPVGTFETHTFSEAPYAEGYYLLKSDFAGSQVLVDWTDGKLNRWANENDTRSTWALEAVEELPVSVSAAGYATLYAPVALTIPADVKAYALVYEDNYVTGVEVEGTIPANTGVVIEAAQGTYNFAISETSETIADNVLTGSVVATKNQEGTLVLGYNGENELGFWSLEGDYLAGFKAYIAAPAATNGFAVKFGNTLTAIQSAIATANNAAIFDLQGRRVANAQKGLYIIDGKKVIR